MRLISMVLLGSLGCATVATPTGTAATESGVPSLADEQTQTAKADLRLRVEQFGASAVIPRGWQYQRFGQAVLTQSPSRSAGLIVFGAIDSDDMQTTLIQFSSTLTIMTGEQSGEESELIINGARFVVITYPQSRIATRDAAVRIGIAHLPGGTLLTFLSYGLDGAKEEGEQLRTATQSIVIE